MLTDTKLKSLKPKDKLYKVSDRDGLYVAVSATGTVSFRYDYRMSGRRETLTIGRYGNDGITLAEARELLAEAKKKVSLGISPAREKKSVRTRLNAEMYFSGYAERYLKSLPISATSLHLKSSVMNREVIPTFGNKRMDEIRTEDVLALCEKIKERGSPTISTQVLGLIGSVYRYTVSIGVKVDNPASVIRASSIHSAQPRNRTLSPDEVGIIFKYLNRTECMPSIKLAIKFILITMVRKNEFVKATWGEFDLDREIWTIPAERMKAGRQHSVYLSKQAMDMLSTFKINCGRSDYLVPTKVNKHDKSLSSATLGNAILYAINLANKDGHNIKNTTVHDLRRTASTLLHEEGFNTDWIEKCLAHEQRGVRSVYNKAEYSSQRKDMLQRWADMVDLWIDAWAD